MKIFQLLKNIEQYYKRALLSYYSLEKMAQTHFTMPDDPEEDHSSSELGTSSEILQAAEDLSYDIVNENLLTQFDNLLNSYKEILKTLEIDPKNLGPNVDPDEYAERAVKEAGLLWSVLETRYNKLINNSYLNLNPDDDKWEESFPSFKVLEIAQAIFKNTNDLFKKRAGEDVDVKDLAFDAIHQEVNQQTGDMIQDAENKERSRKLGKFSEYAKNHFAKLMEAKRFGESHSHWEAYQSRVASKKTEFQKIKQDPERWAIYRSKVNARVRTHREYDRRLNEAKALLARTKDPQEKNSLIAIINRIESSIKKRKQLRVTEKDILKEKKTKGDFDGLIIILRQQLATKKRETIKVVEKQSLKAPELSQYKDMYNKADTAYKADPSPTNKTIFEQSQFALAKAVDDFKNNNPRIKYNEENFPIIYAYRDKLDQLNKLGWINSETIPDEIKQWLIELATEGKALSTHYRNDLEVICITLDKIVSTISSRI